MSDAMKGLASLFVVAWFVFAIFDVSFERDVFRAYTAQERSDYRDGDGLPRLLPNAVNEYRVRGGDVIARIGDFVKEYENCTVFDEENWTCTFSDDSSTFGAKQGEYFERNNLEKFPHLADYGESETLSRFGYVLLQCRWDATSAIDAIMCLFRPFTI